MATPETMVPAGPQRGAPPPAIPGAGVDAMMPGTHESRRTARSIAEFHSRGLSKRRLRDLTSEKYAIHLDGEGDAQWADILHGGRVTIPPHLSGGPRTQENLLRPMTDNMVAYHTTLPFHFTVRRTLGRNRDQSIVDQALANHIARAQRWNALFAEAMFTAAVYGHCPIHAYWRDQVGASEYDPVYEFAGGVPGSVDCWVGDPWDTVYHAGATRTSVHAYSYGRTLPVELVKQAFAHVPGIETLEGNDRLPSASRFQRTSRKWLDGARDVHGTATIYGGIGGQELVAIVCRETMPGVLPEWPDGRLEVIALDGNATTYDGEAGQGSSSGARLLHVGPLPGKVPSAVRVYSTLRFDDVLGKPYVGDLDDLQMLYNQLSTYSNEYIRRSVRAPLAVPEGTDLDTMVYDDNVMLEVPAGAQNMPQFASLPRGPIEVLKWRISMVEQSMFRIGGWQAASRGESKSGDSGRKVLALARADDSVHGPVNQRFKETVEDFAGIAWRLYKEYGDVPSLIDVVGDDAAYLADAFVSSARMSDRPPSYSLVSGFGATAEARAEQLLQMVGTKGADGEPLMRTRTMRAAWPDDGMFRDDEDPQGTRYRRPRIINIAIQKVAMDAYAKMPQLAELPVGHPLIQQAAQALVQQIDAQYPVLMDDEIMVHIDNLSLLTQDETEPPLTRAIASLRQRMYYAWAQQQVQARQAGQVAQPPAGDEPDGGGNTPARTDARSRVQGNQGASSGRRPAQRRGAGAEAEMAQASAAQPQPKTDLRVLS
jgi:hypothetical protein